MKRLLFVIFTFLVLSSLAQDQEVYALLEKGSVVEIESKLQQLTSQKAQQVYKGALLARKASKLKQPKTKLKVFKEGVILLDNAIEKSPNNLEYRFLRYIIQVKSPKFLNYNKNTTEDKKKIEEGKVQERLKLIIVNFNTKNERYKLNI